MRSAKCGFPVRLATAAILLSAAAAAQTTWYVSAHVACPGSGTAGDPFCTIGSGVAAAAPGDTIQVGPGTYHEDVVIDKDALTLRGAGAASTAIVGASAFSVVGPDGLLEVPHFTLEGFRITSDSTTPYVYGVWMNPANQAGAAWQVRACVIEDVDVGIQLNDSWYDGAALIENCIVQRCGTGLFVYGENIVIRGCTIREIGGVGIQSSLPSKMQILDTIIASTGAWAIQRYAGWPTVVQRLLIHDNNLDNPPNLPNAGPFMQYLAEGWPGGFGLWTEFTPSPGPVYEADPLFADPAAGDARLLGGSPAIDAGDPLAAIDPASPYDVLGFGHLRVDDGDFDHAERLDLGAVEFGGLVANTGLDGALAAGDTLALTLWGKDGALYGAFAGLPGARLAIGSQGTLFLDPSLLVLLVSGSLPPAGSSTILPGTLPAAAAGLQLEFQVVQKGPGPTNPLHWTNAEHLTILP
jgi:hypothetical protein